MSCLPGSCVPSDKQVTARDMPKNGRDLPTYSRQLERKPEWRLAMVRLMPAIFVSVVTVTAPSLLSVQRWD